MWLTNKLTNVIVAYIGSVHVAIVLLIRSILVQQWIPVTRTAFVDLPETKMIESRVLGPRSLLTKPCWIVTGTE